MSNGIVFVIYIRHISLDFGSVACGYGTGNNKVRAIFYCLKCDALDL